MTAKELIEKMNAHGLKSTVIADKIGVNYQRVYDELKDIGKRRSLDDEEIERLTRLHDGLALGGFFE